MRPLLVILLAVVVFGGMQLLMVMHAADGPSVTFEGPLNRGQGQFKVEVVLTFVAGPDAFSLDRVEDAPSVLVQLDGREIYRTTERVGGDEPIVIDPVDGIVVGTNQFFVRASPSDQALSYRAIGIRVFRDDIQIAERVVLAEPGMVVQGTLSVEVTE